MSMEEGEPKPSKHHCDQVCQICGDTVGTMVNGNLFVACYVCVFPVCRPCYEYERKDGTQSCPQCKIRYKRHTGSTPIRGDEADDYDVDNVASDINYSSGTQDQKQKIVECMLSWQLTYG